MQSLYYYSGSLTGSSLYFIPNNDNYNEYFTYNVSNLIVCSSLEQILLYSGSTLLFSVPVENTNVYYFATTESIAPPPPQNIPTGATEVSPVIILPQSSSFYITFTPDLNITSSNTALIITGSEVNLTLSQSLSYASFQVNSGSSFSITLSGSGLFYENSLKVINTSLSTTELSITSSTSPLYTSFTASLLSNTYNIEARSTTSPYIQITYDSVGNIPVSPTNSLDSWNQYFNINAASIANSGSTVSLLGGNISEITSSQFSSSYQQAISILGARQLIILDISTGSLSSFPSLTNTPNLYYVYINNTGITSSNLPIGLSNLELYDVSNNKVSGSILDLVSNISGSINILSCSYNNLTGSVPSMSNTPILGYLDCSYNQLSGSISSFASASQLSHFDCSHNALTGSIPTLQDCMSLNYFDASNNKLSDYTSGSVSLFLTYFNAEGNLLSQSSIEGIVNDVYNAGAINGYLNLSGSGNATASIATIETASFLEIDRNWEVYLNGASVIISASFSDNLGGLPMLSGSYYRITDTDIPFTYLNLTGTGSTMPYSVKFAASDNHVYEVAIEGLLTGSLSELNYTSSLEIIEVSASVSGTIWDGVGSSVGLIAYFTGSEYSTYRIIGSLEYNGSLYETYLKYAEAVGLTQ